MSELGFFRDKNGQSHFGIAPRDEDIAPTYAEYMEWKRNFHKRMDKMKGAEMNVRSILDALHDINTAGRHLDELMVLSAQAQALRNQYEAKSVEVPEWLEEANRTLNGEIAQRNRDNLEARLRELNAAESALKSPGERRADISKERARIQQALGQKVEAPASTETVGATS